WPRRKKRLPDCNSSSSEISFAVSGIDCESFWVNGAVAPNLTGRTMDPMVTFPFIYFFCNRRIGTRSGICCRGAPAIAVERNHLRPSSTGEQPGQRAKETNLQILESTAVILQVSESTAATTGPHIEWSIPPPANQ